MVKGRIRVLHCPTHGAGNPAMLSKYERRLGISSTSVSIEPTNYLKLQTDRNWNCFRAKLISRLYTELLRLPLLLWAIFKADVIHYNFGSTIMPAAINYPLKQDSFTRKLFGIFYYAYARMLEGKDMAVLKLMGKGILVTFQGDDARQGDFCRANHRITHAHDVDERYYTKHSDDAKRRIISRFEKYADYIFSLNPDLLAVLPDRAEYMSYSSVDPRQYADISKNLSRKLVIAHSPTHREVKGTKYIVSAIDQLKAQGYDFEFRMIEGVSHSQAMKAFEESDILIDQLLTGWYGASAVEFMAKAKPVVCYIRENDLTYVPTAMREQIPIINANSENIAETIIRIISMDREALHQIGIESREYVCQWHDPHKNAKKLIDRYNKALYQ